MSRILDRQISFADSLEPGVYHESDCLWNDETGCEICEKEMDEVDDILTKKIEAEGHWKVLGTQLTNSPHGFALEHDGDRYWEFDVEVQAA